VSKPDKTHTPIMRQAHYQTWWLPRSRRCESWKEEYASTAAILTSDYQRSLHPCNRAHCYQSKSITDIPGEWTHPLHYSQPKIYKENYYLHCSIHEADSSTKKTSRTWTLHHEHKHSNYNVYMDSQIIC
jgi:hypothetical protein